MWNGYVFENLTVKRLSFTMCFITKAMAFNRIALLCFVILAQNQVNKTHTHTHTQRNTTQNTHNTTHTQHTHTHIHT